MRPAKVYAYTDEVIHGLNAYARSIIPAPRVNYNLVHPQVFVPVGFLPIKITQFFRWDPATHCPGHYHWAIFIPTSPVRGIGNYYELAGDSQPYHIKSTISNHNARRGFERGSHTVGYVSPVMLPHLEAHFAIVPVDNFGRFWNSQDWVCHALQGLNHPLMFAIGMTREKLVTQMAVMLTAWEAGDAD